MIFKTVKKLESKIESLEKELDEKNDEIKTLKIKIDNSEDINNKLDKKNKSLKKNLKDNKELIKRNQQLRNHLSELEDKFNLIKKDKIKLQNQKQKFVENVEITDENLLKLKNENEELKQKFLENEKVKSYIALLKEALILKTFLKDNNKRKLQIIHDFPELSEEEIINYLNHLCELELLSKVDNDAYKCNFSIKNDKDLFDQIFYKIFECDLKNFKKLI